MNPLTEPEPVDAIVVGSNLAALVFAYLLSGWGYRVALVDRSAQVGGMDRSFRNANGRSFDFGFHGLAYMRSEFVTKLFTAVMDGAVRQVEHRRGMVLRGYRVPYNAAREEWPAELQALLRPGELVDTIGSAPPTRERLAVAYGSGFADFVYDEVLASYPSEIRHLAFGVEAWRLLVNLYPWFFPQARRARGEGGSRGYQDSVREGRRESLLYPAEGGFAGFAEGLRRRLEERGVELLLGADDYAVEFDARAGRIRWLRSAGRRLTAPRVYWCASPASLCGLLGQPLPALDPDLFVLGSFEFDRPIRCDFTELIVGDPEHAINRISFPAKLTGGTDSLVQLEFSYPRATDRYDDKPRYWLDQWTRSLRALGIVGSEHQLLDFDFKAVPLLYNCYGAEGQAMPELELPVLPADTNLRPVLPSLRKININTRVPEYLRFLADDLCRPAATAQSAS